MTEALHIENKLPVFQHEREPRGIEAKQLPELRSGKGYASDDAGLHTSALCIRRLPHPRLRASSQMHIRIFSAQNLGKFRGCENLLRRKPGRDFFAGTLDRLQIRHVRSPYRDRRFRRAAGAGKIDRVDELAAKCQNLTRTLPHKLLRALPYRRKIIAVFPFQIPPACPRLTAGEVRAHVRTCMLRGLQFPAGKCPGGDRLRLARLR